MTSQLIQKAVETLEKLKKGADFITQLMVTEQGTTEGKLHYQREYGKQEGYNLALKDVQSLLPQIITGVIEEIVNKLQYRIDVNHLVKDMDIVSPQEIVDLTQDELINTLKEVVKE